MWTDIGARVYWSLGVFLAVTTIDERSTSIFLKPALLRASAQTSSAVSGASGRRAEQSAREAVPA